MNKSTNYLINAVVWFIGWQVGSLIFGGEFTDMPTSLVIFLVGYLVVLALQDENKDDREGEY